MECTLLQKEVLILVAMRFDENSTVYCLSQMRAEGFSTQLVGLNTGLQTSLRGLKVRPDLYLTQLDTLDSSKAYSLLVLSGGQDCVTRLQSDPRVHKLIVATLEGGGYVAAMSPTVDQMLVNISNHDTNRTAHLLFQGEIETAVFVERLIDVVSV